MDPTDTRTEASLKPDANLINAASRYLRAHTDLRAAQESIEAQLYDFVREHFGIIDNPWHKQSYHAEWEHGAPVAIVVVQTYSDEHGSSSKTFRINLEWEF